MLNNSIARDRSLTIKNINMKKRILQYAFLGAALIAVFSSCRKQSFGGEENPTAGKTFVWITEANGSAHTQFFDVFSDIKTVVLFTIRRDAANNADLKKAVTVTLTADADSTSKSGLTPLTGDLYTFPTAADIASGGVYAGAGGITANSDGTVLTVNFASGEFAKNIIYKIDGSKLDLSKTYGAVYKITNFGGFSPKVGYSVIAAAIAVKNAYDGNYDVTGSYTDANIPDAVGHYPYNVDFQTISGTSFDVYNNTDGGYVFGFDSGGSASGYGSWSPEFTIDPATNKVVNVVNAYGQGSGSHKRSGKLDPDGVNTYDPATKVMKVKYIMVSDGFDRMHFDETYTYKGPR